MPKRTSDGLSRSSTGKLSDFVSFSSPAAGTFGNIGRNILSGPGFAHLAFEVPDVAAKRAEILALGGRDVGELVTIDIAGAGRLTLVYLADPEGNIIELQRWH